MAIFTVDLGDIRDECPNLVFPDDTDYAEAEYYPYSDFQFHDYGSGVPSLNTTFTYNTFVFGTVDLSTITIDIDTDGTGDIINAEIQYNALVDDINALDELAYAELIQPVNSTFEDWYIRIAAYVASEAGGAVSVASTAGVTPVFATITTPATPITARNLTVTDTNGTVINLGAVGQEDLLTLDAVAYTLTETFTITFCGSTVDFIVTDADPLCVAKGITAAVNDLTDTANLIYKYVRAEQGGNTVKLIAKESGIPLQLVITQTGADSFIHDASVVANVSSMYVPQIGISNSVTYAVNERGGMYTGTLTVISECDYNVGTGDILSWCYDLQQFDCCFIALLNKKTCCSKKKTADYSASYLQAIMRGIEKSISNNHKESEIQPIVDLGWSICEPLKCGCTNC